MKIAIVTNSHPTNDIRLFHKIACSLAKIADVAIIGTLGVTCETANPAQVVISSDSRLGGLYKLFQAVQKEKPDILICVEPLTLFIGLIMKKLHGCRLVFDVHEFFADAFAERYPWMLKFIAKASYLVLERFLCHRCDLVMGVNELIINQLGFPNSGIASLVLPNYPVKNVWDYNPEIPHALLSICDMSFDLVYIGGLTVDRGLFKMLKSIALAKKQFPLLKVLIVGRFFDPVLESRFYAEVTNYHLNSIVYYQSWLPPEKIGVLLKRAKLGLWIFNPANKRMYNAMPLKVLEYLSAGLPVVTIKSPLMNALIKANNLGLCVDYESGSLANAIVEMLSKPSAELQEQSQRCIAIIEERYNWEALEPSLWQAMKSLKAN